MNINQRAGIRIKQLRKASGVSQKELSGQLVEMGFRMTQPYLVRVEQGQKSLKLDEAAAIAELLGVDAAQLLYGTVDQEISAIQAQQEDAKAELDKHLQRLEEINAKLAKIDSLEERKSALRRERSDLHHAIAYYRLTIRTAEQRLADLSESCEAG